MSVPVPRAVPAGRFTRAWSTAALSLPLVLAALALGGCSGGQEGRDGAAPASSPGAASPGATSAGRGSAGSGSPSGTGDAGSATRPAAVQDVTSAQELSRVMTSAMRAAGAARFELSGTTA